jgi:PAS domain-containing protein
LASVPVLELELTRQADRNRQERFRVALNLTPLIFFQRSMQRKRQYINPAPCARKMPEVFDGHFMQIT